jgi:hypothetical protein
MRRILPGVLATLSLSLLSAARPADAEGQALLILLFGDRLSPETFQLGIQADVTFTNVTGVENSSVRSSWLFGAYGQVRLSDTWSFVPGLTVKTPAGMQGFAVGDAGNQFEETGIPEVDELLEEATVRRETNYLTVPLVMRYRAGRVGLSGGGYFGYMTSGSDKLEATANQGFLTVEDDKIPDHLNRWDGGLQGGIDFMLKPERGMRSMKVHVTGSYGLVDTLKDNAGDPVRNWGIFAGLQIPVGGSDAAEEAAEGN